METKSLQAIEQTSGRCERGVNEGLTKFHVSSHFSTSPFSRRRLIAIGTLIASAQPIAIDLD
eukprot:scaffold24253_cov66-Skeletonema_marinoi.AAC.1